MCLCLLAALARETDSAFGQESYDFQEVFDLLRENLAGVTTEQLNQAAVRGLLEQLAGKVSVVGEASSTIGGETTNAPISATVYERHYAYLRISRLVGGAGREFQAAYERLLATNTLKGLVLDLRFTGGQDYAAAVAVADRFLADEQPLADWGQGWKQSTAKTNAIALPVAILVNRKTTGAAEALAGMLRYREVGLLIGTNTAGQASVSKEFKLKTGQRLRLAVAPLRVAGGNELPFTGIKPDLRVDIAPEDELAWYENAYRQSPRSTLANSTTSEAGASTNRGPRRRLNEADLVRMSRDGQLPDRDRPLANDPARTVESPPATINDPALARALDLLKGLAVVQQFRSI